jgi:HEAT repeat protein
MKLKVFLCLILLTSVVSAQNPSTERTAADSVNVIVDSLFVRASSINVYHAELVQPSKEALAKMGIYAVPRLVDKMKTQDAREMQTLEDVFKLMGHPAVPHLGDALGNENVYRRRLAARVLGEIKDSSSVDGLLKYVKDDDYRMRAGCISALGKIGHHKAAGPAREALRDSDYLVRTAAAVALSFLKDSTSVIALIKALSDEYYGVRYSAAQALSNVGKQAVRQVGDALKLPGDTLALYQLIEIAGNLADARFVEQLTKIVNSDDPFARAFAAEALGKIGSEAALRALHQRYEVEKHPLVISKIEAVVLN